MLNTLYQLFDELINNAEEFVYSCQLQINESYRFDKISIVINIYLTKVLNIAIFLYIHYNQSIQSQSLIEE